VAEDIISFRENGCIDTLQDSSNPKISEIFIREHPFSQLVPTRTTAKRDLPRGGVPDGELE
jgi:hypothetical protein